jgi:hypothetical protein
LNTPRFSSRVARQNRAPPPEDRSKDHRLQPRPAPTSLGGAHSRRALATRDEHAEVPSTRLASTFGLPITNQHHIKYQFLSLQMDQKRKGGQACRRFRNEVHESSKLKKFWRQTKKAQTNTMPELERR